MAISLQRKKQQFLAMPVPGRGKRPKKRNRGFGIVLLSALLFYFVYSSAGQLRLAWELKNRLAQVEREIAVTEQRSEELRREISYLESDAYIEKAAREQLGLVKPGEIIFMPGQIQAVPGNSY
ncbi:MAG: FtsB family cell division protein [bacterium]